ncbi:MAG: WecB/TagA/CpsF family glycosyltransferase [Anaerolineae bacterium]|nr:WecB/TagA/CpsF family glycosyltransferase [Anaerolineae bacterium]
MQYSILNVPVDVQTLSQAVTVIRGWLARGEKRTVSTCTVYTIMAAQDNPVILRALQQADMVTADGMPLVWLQRSGGHSDAGRVYGPDLFLALCEQTAGDDVSHYFLGGMPGVAENLIAALQERFPALKVSGSFAPAVNTAAEADADLVARINAAKPDIVWVGLGSPKQDLWMCQYRPLLDASVLVGVGAAFDFIAGTKRQAPHWMQRSGLEWLFRLLTEPGRLWKRYLVYNSRFVLAIVRDRLSPKPPA